MTLTVDHRIRSCDREAVEDAIADLRRATDEQIAGYRDHNSFAIVKAEEAIDAARRRITSLTGLDE